MASWTGTTPYATKKQLVSSISGLYNDIQDIELSSITIADLKVSTLTVAEWISAPVIYTSTLYATSFVSTETLYASSIQGAGFTLFNNALAISTGDISLLTVSSLQLKAFDLSGSFAPKFELNLGLGSFLGGLVGNLGGLLAGTIGAITGGVGIGTGLAGLTNSRRSNLINNSTYEMVNTTTQLQISTLGYDFPYYSSIQRFTSTTGILGIGIEQFTSTIFPAGTKCVRSVSDPMYLPSMDQASSIQAFGQWEPLIGDDYILNFSTLNGNIINVSTLNATQIKSSNVDITYTTGPGLELSNRTAFTINNISPLVNFPIDKDISTIVNAEYQFNRFSISSIYPDVPVGTSTFGATTPMNPADITGPPVLANFTQLYQQAGLPNTYVTAWNVSTATYDVMNMGSGALQILIPPTLTSNDFINNNRVLVLPNQNRRVSWNIDPVNNTGVSSVTTIPPTTSTVYTTNFITEMTHDRTPYEDVYSYYLTQSPQLGNVAFNCSTMSFGHHTTTDNGIYAFQFYGDTNIYGTLEVDNLIVLSSIIAVSTFINVETTISTTNILADDITITTGLFSNLSTTGLKTSTMSAFGNATFNSNVTLTNGAANFTTNSFIVGAGNAAFPTVQLRYNPILTNSNFGNLTTDGSGGVIISNWYNFTKENTIIEAVRDPTNTTYNSVINISTINVNTISTNSHTSDNLTVDDLFVNSNVIFRTPAFIDGNGGYDLQKDYNIVSTSFSAVSSLQNNILFYGLSNSVLDQQIFNLSASNTSGHGVDYRMSQSNVAQWGSTILLFNDGQNPGDILLPVSTVFASAGFTGTFDLQVAYAQGFNQYVASFYVQQLNGLPPGPIPDANMSTFLFVDNPGDDPNPATVGTWRFTIGPTGWIESVVPNPTPYATVNSNIFAITQTNTDVFIGTTDRLNFIAGDIHLGANVNAENINCDSVVAQSLEFPSVNNNQNVIQMELSNAANSNSYNMVSATLVDGSVFPQTSNNFSMNLSGSNVSFNTKEDIQFTTDNGDTVLFDGGIQNLEMVSGNVKTNAVQYGNSGTGFLQPRAFRQIYSASLGAGQSFNVNVQVQDSGSNTFIGANYNLMPCLASFAVNSAILAFGTVILAPYIDSGSGTWYVNIEATVNAGAAGADATISWNNLLFPYNMMT